MERIEQEKTEALEYQTVLMEHSHDDKNQGADEPDEDE
jgi:hypothetical protein